MAGGIDISPNAGASLAAGVAVATVMIVDAGILALQQQSDISAASANVTIPFRSPIQNKPATYSILVHVNPSVGEVGTGDFNMYVFDAVKVANYRQGVNLTKAPIQTGYNISYHAVLQQATITLEISMSDAMAEFRTGMWTGNASKSIAAFQKLQQLMTNRTLMILSTRQQTYYNMMLIAIDSPETNETYAGMRATLTFEQVFLVGVATTTTSARPNATNSTNIANVPPTPVPASVTSQNGINGSAPLTNVGTIGPQGIPQGGNYSSLIGGTITDTNGIDITSNLPATNP